MLSHRAKGQRPGRRPGRASRQREGQAPPSYRRPKRCPHPSPPAERNIPSKGAQKSPGNPAENPAAETAVFFHPPPCSGEGAAERGARTSPDSPPARTETGPARAPPAKRAARRSALLPPGAAAEEVPSSRRPNRPQKQKRHEAEGFPSPPPPDSPLASPFPAIASPRRPGAAAAGHDFPFPLSPALRQALSDPATEKQKGGGAREFPPFAPPPARLTGRPGRSPARRPRPGGRPPPAAPGWRPARPAPPADLQRRPAAPAARAAPAPG